MKSKNERMEELGKIVSQILADLAQDCVVGATGKQLNTTCEALIVKYGVLSFNKGYMPTWSQTPYPAALCVSPNGVIAHGIPNNYQFCDGDLVTLDLGIQKDGLCGDAALTVGVGKLSNADDRLLRHAKGAVQHMVDIIGPDVNTRDIADDIEKWALQRGFLINRRTSGHTIGEKMHMKPQVYNTVEDSTHKYAYLKENQFVCIEPVLTNGKDAMGTKLSDGWTIVTLDGKKTAMFEHMLQITDNGSRVLTNHFV